MSTLISTVSAAGHDHVNHFAMGWVIPVLAYAVSVTGSFVGLACALQARRDPARRTWWQILAAISIGGVAIWLMHFIAMLGMSVDGSVTRYNLGWTAVSAVLAVAATFLALRAVGQKVRLSRLVLAGVLLGLAVNGMHYMGMYALNIQGSFSYNMLLVAASIAIAVVAGTAALWFTLVVNNVWARLAAGFVMGVAVVGMHFTGMAAMQVDLDPNASIPAGLDVFTFLFPVFVVGLIALAVPIASVMLAGDRDEAEEEGWTEDAIDEPVTVRDGIGSHRTTVGL